MGWSSGKAKVEIRLSEILTQTRKLRNIDHHFDPRLEDCEPHQEEIVQFHFDPRLEDCGLVKFFPLPRRIYV